MSEGVAAGAADAPGVPERSGARGLYAALDLGTNNCRLLIARPLATGGFRVVDAFSRIVRLGEGLSQTGALSPAAMDRALAALKVCADKIRKRHVVRLRAVATQACRAASNGPQFIRRVAQETGLTLDVIEPAEEARLAVAGCLDLMDPRARGALIVDVGGGSTELSWVRATPGGARRGEIEAWTSLPVGVVTLAEAHPEPDDPTLAEAWFETMVEDVADRIAGFDGARGLKPLFADPSVHLVGTSGAITSLAGIHLDLKRYERSRVDGLWLTDEECRRATERLRSMSRIERGAQPCIGPDRADLVLGGAALVEAVQRHWPCRRLRVADRGLREGMLLSLMRRRRRRR